MPSPHDFSNPVMMLAIVNDADGGRRIPLWTNANNPDQGGDKDLPNMAVVSDVTIEIETMQLPKITATMTFPYLDGIQFLASEVISWGKSRLEVQFGYVLSVDASDVSPVFSGLLLTPDVQIGEQVVITLVAIGGKGGYDAASRGHAEQMHGTRSWIIEQLAKGMFPDQKRDLEIDFSAVTTAHRDAYDALYLDDANYASGWMSDWQAIGMLVNESYCWMAMDGNKLVVFPIGKSLGGKPRFALQMFPPPGVPFGPGAAPETDGGVWPILSFNSPTVGIFLQKLGQGLFFKGINSKTGKTDFGVVGDVEKDDKAPTVGTGKAPEHDETNPAGNKNTGDGMEPHHSDQIDDAEKKKAGADKANSEMSNGVQIEVETLGMPNISVRETIRLRGFGGYFDFNYQVFKITHVLGEGGFTTMLTGSTNTQHTPHSANKRKGTHNNEEADTEQGQGSEKSGKSGT